MTDPDRPTLREPVRNRWFYGKLLDEYHMRLESDYGNAKRWLLNRLTLGPGVVLGLDVVKVKDKPLQLEVTPGLALDGWGREVVVPRTVTIDEGQIKKALPATDKPAVLQVRLGYREAEADPVPDHYAGGYGDQCTPGTIRECYKLVVLPGAGPSEGVSPATDPVTYEALVKWVTKARPKKELLPPDVPSLLLANVTLTKAQAGEWKIKAVRIEDRAVVLGQRKLLELILALAEGQTDTADDADQADQSEEPADDS